MNGADTLTARQLAGVVAGQVAAGNPEAVVRRVSTDSRTVRPGDLFIALRGERFDGHRFVEAALANGATVAVVEAAALADGRVPMAAAMTPGPAAGVSGAPAGSATAGGGGRALVAVDDTLQALQELARWHRARLSARVAAVTGSVGKTTTKELLAAVLGQVGSVTAAPASFNNEIGVPLALLAAGRETAYVVLELAMRGPGQIRHLAGVARPEVGIVTNVGAAHIGVLGGLAAIAQAKGELVEALAPGGLAVLNGDDPRVAAMAQRAAPGVQVIYFGTDPASTVRLARVEGGGAEGTRFALETPWGVIAGHLKVPGRHLAMNAAAAAAAALALGAPPPAVEKGLATLRPVHMRMELTPSPRGFMVLNDAYNASPASMLAALETVQRVAVERGGRPHALLGDMLELGEWAQEAHAGIGRAAAERGLASLVGVGDAVKSTLRAARAAGMASETLFHARDPVAGARWLLERLAERDAVLVKGSRAMALERAVEVLMAGTGEVSP